ncbi:hypothetical protein EK21DRAFT_106852 [Setomelanomma holmii]|uniref:Uncharacterized protein n=1 Tax=Setomelanomma holmii TaxID=210430 RepID=A0A9P4HKN1_9PLEO|nr:hypothetical protein EK21DRAFT_106852 [Setomelanomma holmii]
MSDVLALDPHVWANLFVSHQVYHEVKLLPFSLNPPFFHEIRVLSVAGLSCFNKDQIREIKSLSVMVDVQGNLVIDYLKVARVYKLLVNDLLPALRSLHIEVFPPLPAVREVNRHLPLLHEYTEEQCGRLAQLKAWILDTSDEKVQLETGPLRCCESGRCED